MKKILFGVAALGLLSLAGAGLGLKAQDAVEAKAAGTGEYVYFQLTNGSNWLKYTNRFSAYFFYKSGDETVDAWADAVRANDLDNLVYKVEIPEQTAGKEWQNVIFCRMNGATTENSFANGVRWSQTDDIVFTVSDYKGKVCNINTGYDGSDTFGNSYSWGGVYYEQTAVLVGAGGAAVETPLVISDENRTPKQYKIENITIEGGDSVYLKITRNGASTYYGYSALESGTGSLLNEDAVTEGAVVDGDVKKITFNNTGNYSLYLKTDGKLWSQLDSDSIASEYADYFLASFTCGGTEGPNAGTVTAEAGTWTTLASKWDGMVSGAQDIFNSATPNEGGNKYDQVIARYKYVIEKYGTGVYSDFMGRDYEKATAKSTYSMSEKGDVNAAVITVTVTVSAILAAGAIAFARKRRAE